MSLCFVYPWFFPVIGGAEKYLQDIVDEHKDEYDIVIHFELIEHLVNPQVFVSSIHSILSQFSILSSPKTPCLIHCHAHRPSP